MTPRFGAYLLERELSRGGQGVVYAARHGELGTVVALKLLLDLEPRAVARFRQEAQTLSRLEHPNVVKARDMGLVAGQPFLALDLVEGEDLRESVRRGGVFGPGEAARIMAKVAGAVEHCHQHGVVHRDLKPGNVILERGSGEPIVVDFGLLKQDRAETAERLSLTGETKGTPAYMAPEQADPEFGEVGPASDVYALGATLFFLLSGRAPLEGPTTYNLLVRLLKDPPPDLRKVRPEVPPWLAQVCLRAMAKRQEERFPSASAFKDALNRPASAPRRSVRRTGLYALLVVGVVLAVGVGIALSSADSRPVAELPKPEPEPEPEPEPAVPETVDREQEEFRFSRNDAFERAESLRKEHEWEAALLAYAEALRLDRDHTEALAGQGMVCATLGKLGEARTSAERALARSPESVLALRALALVEFREGRLPEAEGLLDQAVRFDPLAAGAFLLRSSVRYTRGALEEALADADRGVQLLPKRAEGHGARGLVLMAMKRYRESEQASTQALAFAPGDFRSRANRGSVRLRMQDFAGAVSDFTSAIAIEEHGGLYVDRAAAFNGLNLPGKAHADLDRALELDEELLQAWVERGKLQLRRRDYASAQADVDRALRLDPGDFQALLVRLQVCRAQRDGVGSLAAAEQMLRLRPQDPLSHATCGDERLLAGDLQGALKAFSSARDLSGDPALKQKLSARIREIEADLQR